MPLTISVPDTLRMSVEAASGGKQTVLYTALGQPSYMNIIPKMSLESLHATDLGTGTHPAFIVGGVEKNELFLGAYPGRVSNGELISVPGVDPSHTLNHDQFVANARANGAGWHCMTNAEWALLGLWCFANGFQPRGNNNQGRDHVATWEVGRRQDGLTPPAAGFARTLTGSGPVSWNHDNTANGISDLNGNIWEWSPGLRINAGEIQVIANNDAALNATDMAAGSAAWKAIDGATGALVAPGHANAVKYAVSGTANYTLVRESASPFEGMTNPGVTPVHADALKVLKSLGLFPIAGSGLGGDGFWVSVTSEVLPRRGGVWNAGGNPGVFALSLTAPRTTADTNLGARPAFVL
jgi:sulfatase modifying factor 1